MITGKKNKHKKRIIKPSRLILLIVLIASNTFAWFIYATRVSTGVDVHVKGWNVTFEAGENEITNEVSIDIEDVYPGMDDYEYSISAFNNSEVSATFSYVILQARILDDVYVSQEQRTALGQQIQQDDMTSAEIQEMLEDDFPFSITIDITDASLSTGNDQEDFELEVTWPYESNQDALDTQWGIAAYDFKEDNPTLPSITITVKLIITQDAS